MIVKDILALATVLTLVPAHPTSILQPRATDFAGYLATYFVNGGTENIHMSISSDTHNFKPLNGGAAILTSNVGTRGARDPVLVSDASRSKFYIFATDLRIDGTTWGASTKTGSHSLVMWSSSDLKTWSPASLLPIEGADAGMTWAPAVVQSGGKWYFFWTSIHGGPMGIFYATTSDLKTFSAIQPYPGLPAGCLDMDLVKLPSGEFARALKCGTITVQTSTGGIFGTWKTIASGIGPGEGPALFVDNKDGSLHLWVDENAGRGYTSYVHSGNGFTKETTQIPSGMRHGNVIGITAAELSRLT